MIGITMGDPNGVGPELVVRGFAGGVFGDDAVVYGDADVLRLASARLGLEPIAAIEPGGAQIVDCGVLSAGEVTPGRISKAAGAASIEYVRRATLDALGGAIDAVVTLPVNKQAVRLSVSGFQGHTEYVAALCDCNDVAMMLASERLAVAHVSTHVSLRQAVDGLRADRIETVARLLHGLLARFLESPRLALAALNPHAGEHGAFGTEDDQIIAPAARRLHAAGIMVDGPLPSDTLFQKAFAGAYDGVVVMYHDQGHIPMKTVDFDRTVNVTLGLPIIRTSVDHGTAYDIAYQGTASIVNAEAAYRYARKLITA